jgi:penicillin amidase
MHHAADYRSFQTALRKWNVPMQNILYADTDGNITIRTAGYLPIRQGRSGEGLRDGTSKRDDWSGRVPFDDLPYAQNPVQNFLASANQQPVGKGYRYYLNHDWGTGYRSLRINQLLRSRDRHSVSDLMSYQADVHVVQRDLFVPLIDTLGRLSPDADYLRDMLTAWDGSAGVERPEPLVLDHYLDILEHLAWDEFDTESVRSPKQQQLHYLLTEEPKSRWLDIQDTQLLVETGADLMRSALETTVDTLRARYGWGEEHWTWGRHHVLSIKHLTRADALSALGYRDVPYPGFAKTLSPARARKSVHSASWRMVVDFSSSPPKAYGVFPGGQSGNPFSRHYDDFIPTYLQFGYYRLHSPPQPAGLIGGSDATEILLHSPAPSGS